MDLEAYINIKNFDDLAKANGIECPRLRGYRLMSEESPIDTKFETGNEKKQYETFNKYVGRNDILCIHARIGGSNWPYYKDQVINQPWFIEKIDDGFDETYCDIYARIKPVTNNN